MVDPKTSKIKIHFPSEENVKMISDKSRSYLSITLFFLIPILIFSASLMLFLMSPSSSASYAFELGRFSGTVEIYSHQQKQWTAITRRSHKQIVLAPKDKIRTLSDSDLDFRVPDVLDLRLKASSEIQIMRARDEGEIKLKLEKGGILGLTDSQFGNRKFEIVTSRLITTIQNNSSFLVQTGKVYSSAGALVGQISTRTPKSKNSVIINALETAMKTDDKKAKLQAKRVNYQEWKALSEARDLIFVSPKKEAEQVDLRKKAGNFFNYVFDEGVFFKPDWGHAEREFYEDPETKQVLLRIDYDVFPQESFSGMYFKVRNLDLSQVHRISMNVKSDPGKPIPNQFRIEFKDKLTILRGFAVKPIARDWKNYTFDFGIIKPTNVSEMVFVFENTRVGPLNTSSTVYVKDIVIS